MSNAKRKRPGRREREALKRARSLKAKAMREIEQRMSLVPQMVGRYRLSTDCLDPVGKRAFHWEYRGEHAKRLHLRKLVRKISL